MPLSCVIVNEGRDCNEPLSDAQPRVRSAAGKLLDLIEVIADGGMSGLTTMELASSAGLDKTTASRLLAELTARDWVARDTASRRYRPGSVFLRAVRAAVEIDPDHINTVIYPLLNELRDASGETATLNRKVERTQVIVAGAESLAPLRRAATIGAITPLTGGPTGKAILAFCPEDFIKALLSELPVDERRIVSGELELIRRQRYFSWKSRPADGLGIIASPVFSSAGEVYGALVLAGPLTRFDEAAREKMAPGLLDAAATVTVTLGGRVPPTK